jgi:hypothetical protein
MTAILAKQVKMDGVIENSVSENTKFHGRMELMMERAIETFHGGMKLMMERATETIETKMDEKLEFFVKEVGVSHITIQG